MEMFCYQCQEASNNDACIKSGACGKRPTTAKLQDLLIYTVKGISLIIEEQDYVPSKVHNYISESLFSTITNANFDDDYFHNKIIEGLKLRDQLLTNNSIDTKADELFWNFTSEADLFEKAESISINKIENEDIRSLQELLTYGVKGMTAYTHHAQVLGYYDDSVNMFIAKAMAATTKDLNQDQMVTLILETGKIAVDAMALLDKANTTSYGNPEISKVNLGVGSKPGILISGHDLKDMKELLEQTKDQDIDIYTHSEMLPAHYYPEFKKYSHLKGNYGGAWWQQGKDFESFNGPILMTTNCITPVKESYQERIFTTGVVRYPKVKHISSQDKGEKDFSQIIELAKKSSPPTEIENGEIIGGFAHAQVLSIADKIIDAVKSGKIKRFVVMAGCDGRQKEREYFTELAKKLPKEAVILTAGCAKYRYNKLELGDIDGIPRVLDAGQCNDSYSLAVIALELKKAFELNDINDLPLSFDIGWYEQKAVTVLLALLHLGIKNIRLGPTLPAFLSPNVANILISSFNIKGIGSVDNDIAEMMAQ